MRGAKGLRQAWRWLESRFVHGGLILLYHSIAQAKSDPYSLQVSPGCFVEQMEVLHTTAHVLSLLEFVKALREGRLPRRAVAVTFDDGYADNLYQAIPILRRFEIPATIFVAAGPTQRVADIGHPADSEHLGELWWDELARLLAASERLPQSLPLTVGGQTHDLGGQDSATVRRFLYRWLRPLHPQDRETVLEQLRASLPAETTASGRHPGAIHRVLSPDEIAETAGERLIQIGAHTVHHPVLANLTLAEQRREIRENKTYLEEITGQQVQTFSYPYGLTYDYAQESVALVRELGFACACGAFAGVASQRSDLYQLPRLWVRDWDGETFARRLDRWLVA